jgi:hypothetical protein
MKIQYLKFKKGILLVILLIFLLNACAISPGPPEKPNIDFSGSEAGFSHADWESFDLKTICLTILKSPDNVDTNAVLETLKSLFTDMGIRTDGQECEAELRISVEGYSRSASYQGKGTCINGYFLNGEIDLISEGLATQVFSVNEDVPPPNSVGTNNCRSFSEAVELLQQRLKWNIHDALLSFWDANIYYYVLIHFYDGDLTKLSCSELEPRAEYVPLIILKMDAAQEKPEFTCLVRLAEIGPDAEEALPYLMYYLGVFRGEMQTPSICNTLESITGEDFGNNAGRWWRWWSEYNK